MIRILTFLLALLTTVLVQAQFKTIIEDDTNDGNYPKLLDAKAFAYKYEHQKDSIYFNFKFDELSAVQSNSLGLNVMISISDADLDKFYFYGNQNINETWNFMLSAWVKKQYDDSYAGYVGIGDANGFNKYLSPNGLPSDLLNLYKNNIDIQINLESKEITLGLLRSELIPNNLFIKDSIEIGISAAVGSYALFNDDLYTPKLKVTLKTSDTFQKFIPKEPIAKEVEQPKVDKPEPVAVKVIEPSIKKSTPIAKKPEPIVQQPNPVFAKSTPKPVAKQPEPVKNEAVQDEDDIYPVKNNDNDPYYAKKAHPNFVDFEFTFNLNSSLSINVVKLMSPEGKEVFRGYTNVVNVEDLTPGQYTLIVKTNNGFELRELVNVK